MTNYLMALGKIHLSPRAWADGSAQVLFGSTTVLVCGALASLRIKQK